MKYLKKIASVLLVLSLFLSLTMPVLAALPSGVKEPDTDNSITIHKYGVKDMTHFNWKNTGQEIIRDGTGDDYNPNIYDNGSTQKTLSQAISDKTVIALKDVQFVIRKGTPVYNTSGEITSFTKDSSPAWTYSASGISQYTPSGGTAESGAYVGKTNDDGKLVFPTLPFGVYQITELPVNNRVPDTAVFYIQVPTYFETSTTDPSANWLYDIHVYPKNPEGEKPTKELTSSDSNKFTYTLTADLKENIAEDKPFMFTDIFDPRLMVLTGSASPNRLQDQVKVYYTDNFGVQSADLVYGATEDYTLTYTPGATTPTKESDKLEISLTSKGIKKLNDNAHSGTGAVGTEKTPQLKVIITAYSNPDAIDADGTGANKPIWNDFVYNEGDYTYEAGDDEIPKTPVGGFIIDKYADGDITHKLDGAEFMLFRSESDAYSNTNPVLNPNKANTAADKYIFGATDSNGRLVINNLVYDTTKTPPGTDYWLVEVTAPTGYNLLTKPLKITVNENSILESNSIKIANNQGFELPRTGGSGTMAFTVIGLSLITIGIVALLVHLRHKKKSDQN